MLPSVSTSMRKAYGASSRLLFGFLITQSSAEITAIGCGAFALRTAASFFFLPRGFVGFDCCVRSMVLTLADVPSSNAATVQRTVTNSAPKAIMLHLVRTMQTRLYAYRLASRPNPTHALLCRTPLKKTSVFASLCGGRALFDALSRTPLEGLLDESEEVDVKRRADVQLLEKLRAAKRALEALS